MLRDRLIYLLIVLSLLSCSGLVRGQESDDDFFERSVRPILIEHCWKCHGDEQQWSGLRLDSREAILRGGENGPGMEPGQPDRSRLVLAVQRDESVSAMPPDDPLRAEEVQVLRRWVEMGGPWPVQSHSIDTATWTKHWAFQPIVRPEPPTVHAATDPSFNHPMDAMIAAVRQDHGLAPSPPVDRATWLRRVTYATTGLPPSWEAIEAFEADPDPAAYERRLDEYLASPQHGEHLARLWLDVARYSDTKGYVYAREERFFVNAALYRDWVIQAFNEDMPYDRFLLLQLAADQVAPESPTSLAAMGFLTLGRRFLGVTHDIIDDRIDVVGRGTMGLTIACARCHDHKYDPIPTADYYALYGVFQCSTDRQVDLREPLGTHYSAEFLVELEKRTKALSEKMAASRLETSDRVRTRVEDYLFAQTELHKFGQEGFDVVIAKDDLIPAFVRRWEESLSRMDPQNDPIFSLWFGMAAVPKESFAVDSAKIWEFESTKTSLHDWVRQKFTAAPASMRALADGYGALFDDVLSKYASIRDKPDMSLTVDERDWLIQAQPFLQVLYGPSAPCEVPDEEVISTETYFDSGTCTELWKLQGEVDRWRLQANDSPAVAVGVFDRATLVNPRILRRGNPANKGPRVTRHFLSFLSDMQTSSFVNGSGRLEMASRIVARDNPLTSRVWVNRLWQHVYGQGLVPTPSDFGLRAPAPSHPELLDWLACDLMDAEWSSKTILRSMLLSATFRQSSTSGSEGDERHERDPENRWLWRANPHRLSFEELRDTMLASSDELNLRLGGKPQPLFEGDDRNRRRSVYGLIDRQFLPSALRVFDFANPDLHVGRRSETLVPQQSLYFLNHPFVASRAKSLVRSVHGDPSALDQLPIEARRGAITQLYRRVLRRVPDTTELDAAIAFLSEPDESDEETVSKTSMAWSYGYGEFDPEKGALKAFRTLPHFTGSAWQGGSQFPDPRLGWVQLTATGGHPGNDQQHACVRRWTAPESMRIKVRSTAKHEPDVSDGVRCSVILRENQSLISKSIRTTAVDIHIDDLQVNQGDTLDFVVDILGELSYDQHLWSPIVERIDGDAENERWDAQRDFTGPRSTLLTRWEQLAQVLLCTNEFAFVD